MARRDVGSAREYLDSLPDDRREVVSQVRELILEHLPAGYQEAVRWGMLSYEVPLERYPTTYNKQPLSYVGLAAQKNGYSLYLVCAYRDPAILQRLREGFRQAGRKLDMGKSCLRFRRLDDLPLEVIGDAVAAVPVDEFIARYERSRARGGIA
jgi:hypothetical protein